MRRIRTVLAASVALGLAVLSTACARSEAAPSSVRPAVVAAHADGIRRRLKGADLEALEQWLASLPAPTREDTGS